MLDEPSLETSLHRLREHPLDQPTRPPSTRVLMADPEHFAVEYVINPHMAGHIGTVDRDAARAQWEALRQVYVDLGFRVDVLPAVEGLPDLTFVANQSFPIQNAEGPPAAILSNMHTPQRQPEPAILEAWYAEQGWVTHHIPDPKSHFEGMGDANWHPGRRMIYGGFGFRTTRDAYTERSYLVNAPVVALQLRDERMYHLDTCFSPLDERTALICAEAFTDEGLRMLEQCFPVLIRAPFEEAVTGLAVNGHCPDQRHFIVHYSSKETIRLVKEHGFDVIEVDTTEFLKSGGSVQCLKLMLD